MSLITWLPLISDSKNRGLSNPTITTTGTIAYNNGKLGTALTFNNTAITLKPAPLNTNTKEFSFAFWFKPTSTNSYQCLYNGRTTVGGAIAIFRDPSNLWRFDDGTQRTFNFGTVVNEWHHYVFTRDESNVKLYIDGVLKQTMTASSFTCETASASIGMSSVSNATPNANPIIGQVNDYRIYNHVLSLKEIKELSKGLCLHFPLDWGANSNMIKNSYTWMNKNLGTTNGASSSLTVSKSMVEDNTAPCHWCLKVSCVNSGTATGAWVGPYFPIGSQGLTTSDLVSGETYTYSFWAKLDSSSTATTTFVASSLCESQTHVSNTGYDPLDSNWRKHTVTFKWTSTGKLTACFYSSIPASSTVTYYLCGIKLEKGSVATPYIPHTSDTIYTSKGYGNLLKQDCSGYNRNATTVTNCAVSNTSPRGISSLDFTAKSSHFNFPNIPIAFTEFTMCIWAYLDSNSLSTSSNGTSNPIALGGNEFARFRLGTGTSATENTKHVWVYLNNGNPYFNYDHTDNLLEAWHHYTITFKGGTACKLYIDGALCYTQTTTLASLTCPSNSLWKIGEYGSNSETCDGKFSDFRFYATCLSDADIKELYQISAQIDKSGKIYCNTYVEV